MKRKNQQFINGQWMNSSSQDIIEVINPASEKVIGTIAKGTKDDVDKAVNAAKNVYLEFRNTSVKERQDMLNRIVEEYKKRKDDIVEVITEELGSPRELSEKTHYMKGLIHFSEARDALDDFSFQEKRGESLIIKESIGVTGLITPWNFPTNQTSVKLAAAFASGSPVILKPSVETPFSAIILAEIIESANLPKGAFNLVNGQGKVIGDALSSHQDVRMMSFTGSENAGRKIIQNSSQDFKRVSLELGGKSPYVILDDADIDKAAKSATKFVYDNTGQVCDAATRTLIPESIKDEFIQKSKQYMGSIRIGNPNQQNIDIGPLVNKSQFDIVQNYIKQGISEGATLVTGGLGKPKGLETGYYVKPTIFSDVNNDMTIAQEEIFGPVMSIITYKTIDEAIQIANDTKFGLCSYVMGTNKQKVQKVASSLESGNVIINDNGGTPDLPFGGYKQSGIGREWGDYGIEEFLETKVLKGYYFL
ncbi:aldehyde dehydrogenase family protein [Staphylococcus pseudoxylosus]|uniref:aldehyde dehydrogenase family protein n=1 Tax=Staphylococcus pseudoxylosus TaxID=2282419 RepID=UPI002DBC80F0|nr:aldehyde dehydrogenase family protein [Staphylococcus pseudoxylosus]MEB7754891.1 aldehyde dehydrogenase family protein [Staphylococcus pseudoxylosus]